MDNTRKFKNLEGDEVIYTYRPLLRKTAMQVEYTAGGLIAGALSNAAPAIAAVFKTATNDIGTIGAMTELVNQFYKAVPFETLWDLAGKVLEGAVIQGPNKSAKITTLDESDYFTDRIEELLIGTFWGLDVSFPRLFTKARELLAGFGEKDLPGQTISKGSNIASAPNSPS